MMWYVFYLSCHQTLVIHHKSLLPILRYAEHQAVSFNYRFTSWQQGLSKSICLFKAKIRLVSLFIVLHTLNIFLYTMLFVLILLLLMHRLTIHVRVQGSWILCTHVEDMVIMLEIFVVWHYSIIIFFWKIWQWKVDMNTQ